jgi:organic hydroperoxide reductase OsmC/OhrA
VSIVKTHRFSGDVRWSGDQLAEVTTPGKPELTVATPPQFRGGVEGIWTPEHLLVASVASCYTVTLAAIAARTRLPLRSLEVRAAGDVTRRVDSSFGSQ